MQCRFTAASNEVCGKCDLNLEKHKHHSNKTSSVRWESISILSTMVSFVWGNYSRVSELTSQLYTILQTFVAHFLKIYRIQSENVTYYALIYHSSCESPLGLKFLKFSLSEKFG